ncbi:SRPBCC family protein [Alteromonadaceae bacterium BrNp21-10]|nr:SRPBCC family protein [Alteromonadaceae bacterium BrNp21-10]
MSNTINLHRVLKAKPEKVYRAFVEPDALARWIPPHGFTCTIEHMDVKVGGSFKMAFRNFTTGHSHSFGGEYFEIEPAKKLRYNDKFDDPNLPGEMMVTVEFKQISVGTELCIEQSGIPDMIPTELCYLGWQESLQYLANLVEPEINQG